MDVRRAGINQAAVAITGGTITGTNVPYVVKKWGIPIIAATTGTMGNNGAVSGMTALPTTYSNGAWLLLPAGAVAAGVPAAATFYWFVGSSTTAGTVYNSTMDATSPGTPGVTTAFSTTGPGAFTGVTALTSVFTISIPANTLGANGVLTADLWFSLTSNANTKTISLDLGSTDYTGGAITLASATNQSVALSLANLGVTGAQQGRAWQRNGFVGAGVFTARDMTASQTLTLKVTRSTATDNWVLDHVEIYAAN